MTDDEGVRPGRSESPYPNWSEALWAEVDELTANANQLFELAGQGDDRAELDQRLDEHMLWMRDLMVRAGWTRQQQTTSELVFRGIVLSLATAFDDT